MLFSSTAVIKSLLFPPKGFHALYRAVIFLLVQFQDHNYTTDICFNMKLLRSVVNIHQKKIIKKKILDKAVFVKTLLVRNDQILDLEGCKLAYHISILIISVGYQDIFQLIIITDLKVLKSLDKLAVRLGFYKSLDICRLDLKIRKVDASTLPSVSMTQNSVLDISLSPSSVFCNT